MSDPKKKRSNLTTKQIQSIVERIEDGNAPTEIAKEFNTSRQCIYKYRRNLKQV
jgi:DNA invertase Pin-like site-specific DNA recombinase